MFAGALLASTALLTGCGLASIGGPTDESVVNYDVKDKVSTLQLRSGSGDAVITESDRSGIHVTETLQWRGDDKPKAEHKVDGDRLAVSYDCGSSWGSCSVNYKIEIPKGLKIDIDAGSGNLTLRGLTGQLDVVNGSGDIEGSDLGSRKGVIENGSGDIELKYTAAPENLDLQNGSGDISVYVPQGSYDVSTDAGSGDTKVDVADTPGAPNKITMESGSGNLNVLVR